MVVIVPQVALAWLLHQPAVTTVILGARTPAPPADNLASARPRLDADDLQARDAASALPREYPGWMLERQGGPRRVPPSRD